MSELVTLLKSFFGADKCLAPLPKEMWFPSFKKSCRNAWMSLH